jgi:cytochrome c peroxidase
LTVGCGPTEPSNNEGADQDGAPPPAADADSGDANAGDDAAANGADAGSSEDAEPADGGAAPDGDDTSQADPSKVDLGDPSLTMGIPGEGPLTVEEIQAWLDNPNNHVTLDVTLPLGLSAGQAAIKGLEDNPLTRAKIELGRQLYFDKRLSADNSVSCADCHHPDDGYARHTQFGVGIEGQQGNRNSPVAYNRILSDKQFWDGRAPSLEAQAVGPIENPIEMGNTHEVVVEDLKNNEGYRIQFEKIFPDGVTIDNVGKAIASFERAIVTGPSPYDYYEPVRVMKANLKNLVEDLDGLKEEDPDLYEDYMAKVKASEAHPMSESAQRGRELFFGQKGGCTACHVGPNFTDEKYHNLGVGMDAEEPDLGRYQVTKEDKDRGAFKTPTVRNIVLSAPYMHDGSQKTLEEVVEWYNKGGHPNDYLSKDVRKLNLTDQDKQDLVAFMKALTGELPKVQMGRLPQ